MVDDDVPALDRTVVARERPADDGPGLDRTVLSRERMPRAGQSVPALPEPEPEDERMLRVSSALGSRSTAALAAALDAAGSDATLLASGALDEVTQFQGAVRSGSTEALRRFLRDSGTTPFVAAAESILLKSEAAAFAAVLSARSRSQAASFLRDFPGSPKTPNVKRILKTLEESAAFEHASRQIGRGNLQPAMQAVSTLDNPELRHRLEAAMEEYHRSSRWSRLRALAAFLYAKAREQMSPPRRLPRTTELSAAARELRSAREGLLAELNALEAALRQRLG